MNILNKIRRWCPQPKNFTSKHFAKLSSPVLAGVIIVEIILLILIPVSYYTLIIPKSITTGTDQTYPLTNDQISAAWPNLPTAKEIVENGTYTSINSSMPTFCQVENYTSMHPIYTDTQNSSDGITLKSSPIEYHIWLQLNDTTWVNVGSQYLSTDYPPYTLPSPSVDENCFLGTGLPLTYIALAIVVIVITLTAGLSYILHKKL